MSITAERARSEEVALQRLRTFGLGILGAAILVNAMGGPLTRLRLFRARLIARFDPLDPPGTTFIAVVADLLSSTDGARTQSRG